MKLFSEYDRFDLEQDIIKLWETNEAIAELIRQHLDRPIKGFDEDELANRLQGIEYVNDLKIQRLWDGFEMMIKNGGFTSKYAVPDSDVTIKPKKKGSKND